MVGYSGTPLAKKLGIKPGHGVALVDAPEGFAGVLAETLPEDVSVRAGTDRTSGRLVDVEVAFFTERARLDQLVDQLIEGLDVDGGLWVAWPKRASKVPTDITEDTVREVFLPLGLVDNKVCAIDEVWSGLRVVWRRELRAARRAGPTS
ncbi:hypothetical protein BH10ACT1_BH10ACT1_04760 [soil metagenome]